MSRAYYFVFKCCAVVKFLDDRLIARTGFSSAHHEILSECMLHVPYKKRFVQLYTFEHELNF